MQDLLLLPEVQSGVLPLLVALIAGLILRPLGGVWSGLAAIIAFYLSASLIEGIQFSPLTSTRKILLAGLFALLLGILIDLIQLNRRMVIPLSILAAVAAALWVIWPVLQRQQGNELWLMAGGAVLYMAWLGGWAGYLYQQSTRTLSFTWILALATGVTAIFGASVKLGQLGVALAAATGAFCLLHVISEKFKSSALFCIPAFVLIGLLGLSGVIYAKIIGYSLILLAAIPPAASFIRLNPDRSRFVQALIVTVVTLPLGILAVVITWQLSAGDALSY